ncbi:MAG TPA: hypothetical protein VF832_14190 [Longimicrobiales bacterium]
MNVESALLWGFVATAVLTGLLAAAQGLGLSRISLPFVLGTMVTSDRDTAMVYGGLLHFVNGWIFTFGYVAIFDNLHQATWWIGALIGVAHALLVLLLVLPVLPDLHPRMASERHGPTPTRLLQPPGFLGLNYGFQTPLVAIVAHVAYGVILGMFYAPRGA